MAQASSAASASDIKSVSSPSQSVSSPTDTTSSLTKSGQDHILSELEDQEISPEKSKLDKAQSSQEFPRHFSETLGSTHLSSTRKQHKSAIDSPETIDDDDVSATEETGFNPTRDNLTDGLVGLLRPSLEALDKGVSNTREAQNELKDRINSLEQQLTAIEREQNCPVDLEAYIHKLDSSKKRILVVNTILQGAQVSGIIDMH